MSHDEASPAQLVAFVKKTKEKKRNEMSFLVDVPNVIVDDAPPLGPHPPTTIQPYDRFVLFGQMIPAISSIKHYKLT